MLLDEVDSDWRAEARALIGDSDGFAQQFGRYFARMYSALEGYSANILVSFNVGTEMHNAADLRTIAHGVVDRLREAAN